MNPDRMLQEQLCSLLGCQESQQDYEHAGFRNMVKHCQVHHFTLQVWQAYYKVEGEL